MSSAWMMLNCLAADRVGAPQHLLDADDDTSELSLIIAMKSLPMAGMTIRIACGRTIRRMSCRSGMPSASAASRCPRGTAWMPARKISVMYAP